MQTKKIKLIFTVALMACSCSLFGQATHSPFSRLGIGDLVDPGLINSQGMGGIGVSNSSVWYLNNKNPALLPVNRFSNFSAGYVGEYKTFQDSARTENSGGGNLNYLILAFPVKPGRWTTSVGINPYSYIDYDQNSLENVVGSGDTAVVREKGYGGINQFFWSNGVRVGKNFGVGLKISYLFGSVNSEFSNTIVTSDLDFNYSPTVSTEVSLRDFMLGGGLTYQKDSVFHSGMRLGLGLTYDFKAELSASKFQSYERRILDQPSSRDTLIYDTDGSITIPSALSVGASLGQGTKWTAGVDLRFQDWSDFTNYEGEDLGLKNTWKISSGVEFTPDASSVNNYFKRVSYRLGMSYETLPYVPRSATGEQVKDFGINFGWSLPVSRLSSIDMAFKIGQRGNVADNYIKENYYRIYLGFTFNDQWFIPRKYD